MCMNSNSMTTIFYRLCKVIGVTLFVLLLRYNLRCMVHIWNVHCNSVWAHRQKVWLAKIHEVSELLPCAYTNVESLLRLNPVPLWLLSEQEVDDLPYNGDYCELDVNGHNIPLDWVTYKIDTIGLYYGILQIGRKEGEIRKIRVQYAIGDDVE